MKHGKNCLDFDAGKTLGTNLINNFKPLPWYFHIFYSKIKQLKHKSFYYAVLYNNFDIKICIYIFLRYN